MEIIAEVNDGKKNATIRTVWVVKCSSPEINQKKQASPPHRLCHKLVQPCSRTNSDATQTCLMEYYFQTYDGKCYVYSTSKTYKIHVT